MRVGLLLFLLMLLGSVAQAQQRQPARSDSMRALKIVPVLPRHFYTQHLSFFCRQEVQLQKATKLHVFFRLGAKDYVDYLERKPNARKF